MKYKHLLFICIVILVTGCGSDSTNNDVINEIPVASGGGDTAPPASVLNLPDEHFNYANIELPTHYTTNFFPPNVQFQRAAIELDNSPEANPITDAGATLGRVLFYDKKLSANETKSCSSCHQQAFGFADPDILSEGFDGGHTARHSMGLADNRFYFSGKYFWDERAATLEEQVLMPIQDPVEMGMTLEMLVQVVSEQEYYPDLFSAAYGDSEVTTARIANSLAQFQRSIVNINSRYDQVRTEHLAMGGNTTPFDDFPGFTADENAGKRLFLMQRPVYDPDGNDNGDTANCAGCHISEAFVATIPPDDVPRRPTDATINGLDTGLEAEYDIGIGGQNGRRADEGKFKTPSLANIAVTAPYMHDGRFTSLDEVIEHYSTGIQDHPNLVAPLRGSDGRPIRFNFTEEEKMQLIAFLNTLTDNDVLTHEKWSDPFVSTSD